MMWLGTWSGNLSGWYLARFGPGGCLKQRQSRKEKLVGENGIIPERMSLQVLGYWFRTYIAIVFRRSMHRSVAMEMLFFPPEAAFLAPSRRALLLILILSVEMIAIRSGVESLKKISWIPPQAPLSYAGMGE